MRTNSADFAAGSFVIVYVFLVLFLTVGWVKGVIHLCQCDFEAPYKAEIIYSVGTFVPVVGGVVGWMDFGK